MVMKESELKFSSMDSPKSKQVFMQQINQLKISYKRYRRQLHAFGIVLFILVMGIFTIKKIRSMGEESIQMNAILEYINKEMDRILMIKTREKQNEAFLRLNPNLPIKPVRMTLTTAVFKYTYLEIPVILKRVIFNPKNFLNEDIVSAAISGPHLMRTIRTFRTTRSVKDGEVQTLVWLISEFLDVKVSQSSIRGNEKIIRAVVRDTLKGLARMHSRRIAHLDLKIGNIMGKTTSKGVVYKIIDFGYSQVMPKVGYKVIPEKNYGTYPYKAPEIVFKNTHGLASDIWSVGAIAWFLSLQYTPFYADNYKKDVAALKKFLKSRENGEECHRFFFARNTSRTLRAFIKTCMKTEPEERPTAIELLNHPFILEESVDYESYSDKTESSTESDQESNESVV